MLRRKVSRQSGLQDLVSLESGVLFGGAARLETRGGSERQYPNGERQLQH